MTNNSHFSRALLMLRSKGEREKIPFRIIFAINYITMLYAGMAVTLHESEG